MSEYEINKGTLHPIDDIKKECEYIGLSYTDEGDMRDLLMDGGGYAEINDKWYKVEWEIQAGDTYGDFAFVDENGDGVVSFHTMHYNGGAHWTEVVEWAIRDGGVNSD